MRLLLVAVLAISLIDCATASAARPRHRKPANRARVATAATKHQAQLLKRFDTNGNGQLDPDERAAALVAIEKLRDKRSGKSTSHAGQLKYFDTNGDGQIDQSELKAAIDGLAAHYTARHQPAAPARD